MRDFEIGKLYKVQKTKYFTLFEVHSLNIDSGRYQVDLRQIKNNFEYIIYLIPVEKFTFTLRKMANNMVETDRLINNYISYIREYNPYTWLYGKKLIIFGNDTCADVMLNKHLITKVK